MFSGIIITGFFMRSEIPSNSKLCERGKGGGSIKWWPNSDSNQGHADFQSAALPTELLGHSATCYNHF